MQYMLIHAIDETVDLDERQAARDQSLLATWLEEVVRRGVDLHGSRLRPTSDATTVRVRKGELLVSDGPFAETKEQVAGYDVVECASAEEAIGWASKHPTAIIGAIEVRPLCSTPRPAPLPAPKEGKMRYVLFVCLGQDFEIGPQDEAEIGPATGRWAEEMDGRGVRLFGSQLEGVDKARTVRLKGEQLLVTDGPFAETKEQIAGFDILECNDLDEALEVAAKHPMAKFGMLELRPFWPFAGPQGTKLRADGSRAPAQRE
ncbi:MAG TPA: YciI family protein [Acidimicrobiales bacterium]|nr:YciI family protein [Acidimicrobiales bacterium]